MLTGCVPLYSTRTTEILNCTATTSSRWTPSLLLRWLWASTQVNLIVCSCACYTLFLRLFLVRGLLDVISSFVSLSERIQSDPEAFIMLGYLNEHLELKRQALHAYQRCVFWVKWIRTVFYTVSSKMKTLHYSESLLCSHRAVELLQSMSSTEELAFALGSYGRALW